ncbi:GNAT family N-acetyltransferase [Streptomyces sp. NPDC002769]|uniref:GNAT family N-acetyltransferase n=1 Tax=Streptomyces sp. NPDC002769 TaxID=3154542 RepID=UPI00332C2EDF
MNPGDAVGGFLRAGGDTAGGADRATDAGANGSPAAREEVEIKSMAYTSSEAAVLVEAAASEEAARYRDQLAHLGGENAPGLRNDPSDFVPPWGAFFVAFLDGQPVGCGGWTTFRPGLALGELKKIYVTPAARKRGVARHLVAAAEDSARAHGRSRLLLEAGTQQPEALALYKTCGYQRVENYGWFRNLPEVRSYARDL